MKTRADARKMAWGRRLFAESAVAWNWLPVHGYFFNEAMHPGGDHAILITQLREIIADLDGF